MNSGLLSQRKMVVFGLDCADAQVVFDTLSDSVPMCRSLSDKGFAAVMRSTDPPLTIPAWTTMTTGKDPGQLGLYGIRIRTGYDYDALRISTSHDVRDERIWDILGKYDLKSIIVGIPQTYPVIPLNGVCVAGIPAPDAGRIPTWPGNLEFDLQSRFPDYRVDIGHFRTMSSAELVHQLFSMTRTRFAVFRHLLKTYEWNFAMMVEIGLDRLHHAFWHHWDSDHPLYITDSPFQQVIPEYYSLLDQEIADTLPFLPSDCGVLIVSDHGAQAMRGGIRINQWLIRNGWLTLKKIPSTEMPLQSEMVNWNATRAWGEGGYFGRIFMNVAGREPCGTVSRAEYRDQRLRLASELTSMRDLDGNSLRNRTLFPEDLYSDIRGIPPDLMVYFGNLAWRALGGVGPNPETYGNGVFTVRNDRGPDGANHDFSGICISNFKVDSHNTNGTFLQPGTCSINEIMSTVLNYFDITQSHPVFFKDERSYQR
jgi:predicted AlkP superfamily phosphohydrolase/phosphomutase